MRKPLFIAIGVHDAAGLPTLPGVIPSIDAMARWANDAGYDVAAIDDRDRRVFVDQITDTLTPRMPSSGVRDVSLLLDRPRIVVYFCGHGLHATRDQYWILSSGPDQPDERISSEAMRDALASYGPRQVAVFSDACRSPMALQGLARAGIATMQGLAGVVQKDNFLSAQDGEASFSMPPQGDDPGYCVFSRTLLSALSAPPKDKALDSLYRRAGELVVSSQSLAAFLESEVPDSALEIGKLQLPDCDPGFRPEINDYARFPGDAMPPAPDPAAGPGPKYSMPLDGFADDLRAPAEEPADWRLQAARSEWRKPFYYDFVNFAVHLRSVLPSPGVEQGYVFLASADSNSSLQLVGASGAMSPDLTFAEFEFPFSSRRRAILCLSKDGFIRSDRSTVMLCKVGALVALIPQFRGLWCSVILERGHSEIGLGGVEFLGWGYAESPQATPPADVIKLSAAEALKGLSNGALSSNEAATIAGDMRKFKHVDPLYGIVAAYLYNRVGDIDNIHRMCYYYHSHGQDVPFDIAMLAQVELSRNDGGQFHMTVPAVAELPEHQRTENAPDFTWEETYEVPCRVAGVTPVLRLGWQHLFASPHKIHAQCVELAGSLTESPVATLHGEDAAYQLVRILQEF